MATATAKVKAMAWMDDVVVVGDGNGAMDNGDGDSNGNSDGDNVMDDEGR